MQYQNLKAFREHADRLVELEKLSNAASANAGIIGLQLYFYRMTLDTTISVILGNSIDDFQHETCSPKRFLTPH
jgi:hypothetical protein